jgi:F-type H+-transporting ATPase subunit epsilon
MENSLSLFIKNPEKILFKDEKILSIRVPLLDGSLGIRPGHAPLLGEVKSGKIQYIKEENGDSEEVEVNSGILQILKNQVTIYSVDTESQNMISDEDDIGALNSTLLNLLYDQFSKEEVDGS